MADRQAWEDRDRLIKLLKLADLRLGEFIRHAKQLAIFKTHVLDDSARKSELKKIIDEDPDWSITKIQGRCAKIKAIHDYLLQENI